MKANLEKATADFIKHLEAQGGKPLYTLTPAEARKVLENLQSGPIDKPHVKIEEQKIHDQKKEISIRIFRPENSSGKLPIIFYVHGGGWVLGSHQTHDLLVRRLALGAKAAVIFVNYTRSPEAHFPIAIEECYAALEYIKAHGEKWQLDTTRLALVGDSVGGNMAIALTLLAKERHGPKIDCQLLFYPVTSSAMNTPSYEQFAQGPWLTKKAMEWFWNSYAPDVSTRQKPTLSPLHAPIEQLRGLPPALLITDENDVLRDEGEQYGHHLMQAGVEVASMRILGTVHDFMMLNPLAHTPAVHAAFTMATAYLTEAFSMKKLSKKAA